jgi:hypothetical protein
MDGFVFSGSKYYANHRCPRPPPDTAHREMGWQHSRYPDLAPAIPRLPVGGGDVCGVLHGWGRKKGLAGRATDGWEGAAGGEDSLQAGCGWHDLRCSAAECDVPAGVSVARVSSHQLEETRACLLVLLSLSS